MSSLMANNAQASSLRLTASHFHYLIETTLSFVHVEYQAQILLPFFCVVYKLKLAIHKFWKI